MVHNLNHIRVLWWIYWTISSKIKLSSALPFKLKCFSFWVNYKRVSILFLRQTFYSKITVLFNFSQYKTVSSSEKHKMLMSGISSLFYIKLENNYYKISSRHKHNNTQTITIVLLIFFCSLVKQTGNKNVRTQY